MSNTNWTEVGAWAQIAAAIGTFLYLGASLLLWRSTRRAADAAVEQAGAACKAADAASEQAAQTAKVVAAAKEQAAVAEEQFKLSRQMFIADSQPLIIFDQQPKFVFAVPASKNFQISFTIRNQGKVTAIRVRWRVQIMVGGSLLKVVPPSRSTELAPNQIDVDTIDATIPGTVEPIPPAAAVILAAYIEVQYTNPLDKSVHHSMCEIRRDPQSGKAFFVPFIGRDIADTPTDYCLGVPFA